MATALTSSLQHQHSSQQFSVIPNSSSLPAPSPLHPSSPSPNVSDNFCKECGLVFESHTSLEVHLSYHRSNLLSRWASQDPQSNSTSNNTIMDSKFQPKADPSPQHAPHPPTTATTPTNMSPHFYDTQGQYSLHPEYHHHSDSYGRHHYAPPNGPPQHGYDPTGHRGHRDPPKDRSAPTPEEILDLDSNKVHIYNLPHHQQLQYIQANNFYRPYLMTPQPTHQSPNHGGGGGGHLAPPNHNVPPPPPFPQDLGHGHGHQIGLYRNHSPPSRSPNVVMSPYEFGHSHGQYPPQRMCGPGPGSDHQGTPPLGYDPGPAGNHPGPPTFRGSFPPKPFSDDSRSPEPTMSSPGLLIPVTGKGKVKKGKATGGGSSGPVNGNNEDSNSPAPSKTKGWKGGECKRPKTYNCTACNKWFTSSGHLKRHYGTTLHKNSLRQRGENPDDEPTGPLVPSGKKSKALQQQLKRNSGEDCNGSGESRGGDSNNDNGINVDSRRALNSLPIKTNDPLVSSTKSSPNINGGSGGGGGNHGGGGGGNHGGGASNGGNRDPTNGHRPPDFNQMSPAPPTTSSYPTNPPTYLHVYHNGLQGPPPQSPYAPMGMGMSPHGQFHQSLGPSLGSSLGPSLGSSLGSSLGPSLGSSLGYDTTGGLMSSQNVYTVSVPTSMYNSGYPAPPPILGPGDPLNSLPPFGTVLSPYEQQFHAGLTMTSNGPMYLHHGSVGPPPGSPPFDSSESGIHSNSTSDGHEHHLKNGESPEAVRSASAASGLEVSDAEMMDDDALGCGSTSGSSIGSTSGSIGFSSGSDDIIENSVPVTSTTEGQVIKCPNCSKTFNRACYLTQHKNSSHSGWKPFKCNNCGKRFREEPLLSDHVAKHGNNKPYKCDLCPKQFNHKTDLRRHLCLHSGEKPFSCSFCGKGFIRKDHMTKHCETHRKVKGQSSGGSNS